MITNFFDEASSLIVAGTVEQPILAYDNYTTWGSTDCSGCSVSAGC